MYDDEILPSNIVDCLRTDAQGSALVCEMMVVCRRVTGSEGEEESNRPAVSGRRDDTGIGWCLEPIAVSPFFRSLMLERFIDVLVPGCVRYWYDKNSVGAQMSESSFVLVANRVPAGNHLTKDYCR